MEQMNSGIKPKMPAQTMGMEMSEDTENTTVDEQKYPQLQGAVVGQPVSGQWQGKVSAVQDGKVTIQYDSMQIETKNKADKALERMTGQQQGPANPQEQGGDGPEEY